MNEEIKKLLTKAERNDKEALKAVSMLVKVYAYGLKEEKKDLEIAKFWANKAKELEQKLSDVSNITKNETNEKMETNNIFINRFNNIQNNLKFVGTKDNIDNKQSEKGNRFDNIQNNLKYVTIEDKKEDVPQ